MPVLPTNTAFRNALQAMTVTGVTTHYDYPPASMGELPAAFLTVPVEGGLGEYALSCINEDKTRSLVYVICLEAVAQDNNEQNYDLIAPAMDNLESALDTTLGTLANFHEYSMTAGEFTVSGNAYWSIIATVSIRSV